MAASHAKFVSLFPTGRAIPEALQIGRGEVIGRVEAVVSNGTSVLLLEERRIGKSSVGRAVIERIKAAADGRLGIMVDLRYASRNSSALASQLLSQAREQGADKHVGGLLRKQKLSVAGQAAKAMIAEAGKVFEEEDEAKVVEILIDELRSTSQNSVGAALKAVDAYGRLRDRRIVVFFDEIQDLAKWSDSADVQRALASIETQPGAMVSYIFAGSERSAVDDLFIPNGELEFLGQRVELPEIPVAEWQRGLKPRFGQAGLKISPDQIAQIYLATGGHPLRTMSVCAQVLVVVEGDEVTTGVVNQAVRAAENHPSWKS